MKFFSKKRPNCIFSVVLFCISILSFFLVSIINTDSLFTLFLSVISIFSLIIGVMVFRFADEPDFLTLKTSFKKNWVLYTIVILLVSLFVVVTEYFQIFLSILKP